MSNFHNKFNWMSLLPAAVLAEINACSIVKTVSNGETLYKQGDDSNYLYRIISGFLKLKTSGANGNDVIITIYGPDTSLGEVPVISGDKRAYTAVSMGEAKISFLSKVDFERLSEIHPDINRILLKYHCGTIASLLTHIEDTALLSLKQRIGKLFIEAARVYGREHNGRLFIEVPLSQIEIGEMLGVTRHSVQRELKIWTQAGTITKEKSQWVILNLNHLRTASDSDDVT